MVKNKCFGAKSCKTSISKEFEIKFKKWRAAGIGDSTGNLRKCDANDISATVWDLELSTPCPLCCFLWCLRLSVSENRGTYPRKRTQPNPFNPHSSHLGTSRSSLLSKLSSNATSSRKLSLISHLYSLPQMVPITSFYKSLQTPSQHVSLFSFTTLYNSCLWKCW